MGATSALLVLAESLAREIEPPDLFVVDALGDHRLTLLSSLPTCVGVVRVHEREALLRLLDHLAEQVAARKALTVTAHDARPIVLLVDGLTALRQALEDDGCDRQLDELEAVIADGVGVGVHLVAATSHVTGLPTRVLSQIGVRWVFHLADPIDAATLGVPARLVPAPVPGRLIDARTQLEARLLPVDEQLLLDRACSLTANGGGEPVRTCAPNPLRTLPERVEPRVLPEGVAVGRDTYLPFGLDFAALRPAGLPIAAGEHAIVLGPARSGRSTSLLTLATAWAAAHADGTVVSLCPRRHGARVGASVSDVAEAQHFLDGCQRGLLVIDDAELVDDTSGWLAALVSSRQEAITVIAAGRPDALRVAYGHWTGAVRRSRLGLVMASCSDLDGDLLSVVLPRRSPIPARPGLAWLVAEGASSLVQIAWDDARAEHVALDAIGAPV